MSAEKVVQDFCDSWSQMNIEKTLSYLSDDCFYHNIPMEPCVGKAAIRAFLEPFAKNAQSAKFEVKHATANGNVVMNERVDTFVMGPKTLSLPVAGVFEVRDGKITAWRDYFDLATFQKALG
jgi:limonene-1,2-epoxide hydrolase